MALARALTPKLWAMAVSMLLCLWAWGQQPPLPAFAKADEAADAIEHSAGQTSITSLRQLRQLTPEEAKRGLPVDVTGVITYIEVARDLCIIQNNEGAAYVAFRRDHNRLAGRPDLRLSEGDLVRLRGITAAGNFTPSIWHPPQGNIRVVKLGKAPLPEPIRLFPTVVLDPPLDNHRVEITGVVVETGVKHGRTYLAIHDGYDAYDVFLKGPPRPPESLPKDLINSRIVARGVYGSITQERQLKHAQFYVPSLSDIEIVERGAESVFEKEPLSFEALNSYRAITGERVHVQGVVTASLPPHRLFLRMEDGPLEVRVHQSDLPEPGTRVHIAGYRGLEETRPYLHTVAIRESQARQPLEPTRLSLASPPALMQHGAFVSIEAELRDLLATQGHALLHLDDGVTSFTAELPIPFDNENPRPQEGSWLRLHGILLKSGGDAQPPGFRLQLRDAADIEILRRPPFWTGPRVALGLGVVGLVAGGLFAWSAWLSQKVRTQARILAEKSEAEKVQEERNRISRELHDTLEQDLVAIRMQLNLARDDFARDPPTAQQRLESARRILDRTRLESRHSIQELREEDFANGDFCASLQRLVDRFQMDSDVAIECEPPPGLPPSPELQRAVLPLLREAIHNAIKHAGASQILLTGENNGDGYILEVRDDGRGFDPVRLPAGHFGVLGMRERAGQMGGRLDIISAPGQGTRVRLILAPSDHTISLHGRD